MADTIAAIATGYSVSAIGIVRLSGDSAIDIASRLFTPASGRPVGELPSRALSYGELRTVSGELLDLCMCTVSRAPNSYTGENTAEFQCHGSPAVLRALLGELFLLGARQALPGEFTKRAFLNGRMELTSAEAVADLIDAQSVAAAVNAASQLSGAIDRRAGEIYSSLADICSHYHAVLDYPDEDIEPFVMENYESILRGALDTLGRLLKSYDRGRLMNSGIPAVIIGRPNAGKSSLLNLLLGYERAIVTDVPGTTRDTIEEKINLGGTVLRLIDTAGIREARDEAERLGVERSRRAVESAELAIAVIDGSERSHETDAAILELASGAPKAVVVLTKRDKADFSSHLDTDLPVVEVSSKTGEGLDELEALIKKLFPLPDVPAGEILTSARQAEAIATAADYMKAALSAMESCATPDIVLTECEGAMEAIGSLNGRTVREDVTNRIFSRFCVGK